MRPGLRPFTGGHGPGPEARQFTDIVAGSSWSGRAAPLKVARREAASPFSRIPSVCWCLGPKGWVGPGLERSGSWFFDHWAEAARERGD